MPSLLDYISGGLGGMQTRLSRRGRSRRGRHPPATIPASPSRLTVPTLASPTVPTTVQGRGTGLTGIQALGGDALRITRPSLVPTQTATPTTFIQGGSPQVRLADFAAAPQAPVPGFPSPAYFSAYDQALAAQRAMIEADFARALAESQRRETRGQSLVAEQPGLINQTFGQTNAQLANYAANIGAAPTAAGIIPTPIDPGAVPGFSTPPPDPNAYLQPFQAASALAQGAAQRDVGYLRSGVSELATRQAGALAQARSLAMADLAAQELQRRAAIDQALFEAQLQERAQAQRANTENQQILQRAMIERQLALDPRLANPLDTARLREQELQNQLLERQLGTGGSTAQPPRAFRPTEINPARVFWLSRDYSSTTQYRQLGEKLGSYLQSAGKPSEAVARFMADSLARQYPIAASQVIADFMPGSADAALAGLTGQG